MSAVAMSDDWQGIQVAVAEKLVYEGQLRRQACGGEDSKTKRWRTVASNTGAPRRGKGGMPMVDEG